MAAVPTCVADRAHSAVSPSLYSSRPTAAAYVSHICPTSYRCPPRAAHTQHNEQHCCHHLLSSTRHANQEYESHVQTSCCSRSIQPQTQGSQPSQQLALPVCAIRLHTQVDLECNNHRDKTRHDVCRSPYLWQALSHTTTKLSSSHRNFRPVPGQVHVHISTVSLHACCVASSHQSCYCNACVQSTASRTKL